MTLKATGTFIYMLLSFVWIVNLSKTFIKPKQLHASNAIISMLSRVSPYHFPNLPNPPMPLNLIIEKSYKGSQLPHWGLAHTLARLHPKSVPPYYRNSSGATRRGSNARNAPSTFPENAPAISNCGVHSTVLTCSPSIELKYHFNQTHPKETRSKKLHVIIHNYKAKTM